MAIREGTKITVTLEQSEASGTDRAMADTIALLSAIGSAPTQKVVLHLEPLFGTKVTELRDRIILALAERPAGIDVGIKTVTDEAVVRGAMHAVTPMDKVWSATITPEMADVAKKAADKMRGQITPWPWSTENTEKGDDDVDGCNPGGK